MVNKDKRKIKRTFKGTVVSDKGDKTVVVRVDRVKLHSKYHKRYTVSKKYKTHDEKNEYRPGDEVMIQECRPLSKDKRWRVVGKVGKKLVVDEIDTGELKELESLKEVQKIEKLVEEKMGEGEGKQREDGDDSESVNKETRE